MAKLRFMTSPTPALKEKNRIETSFYKNIFTVYSLFQTEVQRYSKNLKNSYKVYFFLKFLSEEIAIPT
jgi:hypothetical protein